MALDVGRLRVLVEVARAGSIAEAARRMSYTPSAVSQQLSKLEAELRARLVERSGSGVRLTGAAGQPPGDREAGPGHRALDLRRPRRAQPDVPRHARGPE